jgi:amino acid transporter
MSGLDVFAAFVLLIVIVTAIAIWVALAMLPGRIAKSRNHPQAEAINVGGWLGALLLFVLWPLVLIWAFTKPQTASKGVTGGADKELKKLQNRISSLEAKLAAKGGRAR